MKSFFRHILVGLLIGCVLVLPAEARRRWIPYIGAAGPWTPASLSPLVWLKSSSLALSNNDPVGTWTDSSGNGKDATGTGTQRPTYKTSIINGLPAVQFASPNFLTGSVSVTGTTMSVVFIGTMNSASASDARLISMGVTGSQDYNSTSYAIPMLRNFGGQAVVGYRNSGALSNGVLGSYGMNMWVASVFDGTNQTMYINNSGATPASSSGTFGIVNYRIGENLNGGGSYFDGYVYEMFIVSGALSSTDRTNIAAYVSTTYGF